jgi:hypothetical protein
MSIPVAKPDVVRLGALPDLVAAVPHLLGFVPTESLVAVALRGRRERMSFTLRLDLQDEEYDADVARMFAARMTMAGADSVLVFVYTARRPVGRTLPRTALVDAVRDATPMPIRDAILVADQRLWSYTCSERSCCPDEGRRLDPASSTALALSAAHALHGRAVLGSRDDLVSSAAPIGGVAAKSMRQAMDRAMLHMNSRDRRMKARRLLTDLCARYATPPATVEHEEAAHVAAALHDVVFRDEVIRRLVAREDDDALRALVTDVARLAQPPYDAPIATLLAWLGYDRGSGVVADAALIRALASDPCYNLALLLRAALDGQMPPEVLRGVWRDAQ